MITIAIVGRPNVGKSRLFNRIIGRRHSIVHDTPGVTRDRVEFESDWHGRMVRWIDTGGIGLQDDYAEMINFQADVAIAAADVLIFVVDGREGPMPLDRSLAKRLRGSIPVVVAVNKCDLPEHDIATADFGALGYPILVPVSAEHGRACDDLVDAALALVPVADDEEETEVLTKVAIVGRPNVGKSSILNVLLGEDRVMVSPLAGTTRDAIDCTVDLPSGRMALIDTAGIRKRRTDYDQIESVMVLRTRKAVERSDVSVVVTDASEGFTDQDARILSGVLALGRGAVIALNKWDLVKEKNFDRIVKDIRYDLGTEAHVPIVSISAKEHQRVTKVFEVALQVSHNAMTRVKTRDLNRILADVAQAAPSGMRIKYAMQKGVMPPTFLIFGTARPSTAVSGFLRNRLRELGGFEGVPVVLEFRK